jgi:hypothetical protein
MVRLRLKENTRRWSKEMFPVFLVFAFSIIFSLYLGDHSASGGWKVVYRISGLSWPSIRLWRFL